MTPRELFDCERVNDYLESYLLGQVPPPERRGMRLHIHRCPECFEKVTTRDPLQLFAPLAEQERPEESWEGFWNAIRDGIGAEPPRRRGLRERLLPTGERTGVSGLRAPRAGRPAWAGVALAAAAVVILVAAIVLVWQPREATRPVSEPHVAGFGGVELPDGPPVPQTVEIVHAADPEHVQVYSMKYEMSEGTIDLEYPVTELVLIVDAGLDPGEDL